MAYLFLGITLSLWGLQLLGIVAVSSVVLGLLALITGIVFIISALGGPIPAIRR